MIIGYKTLPTCSQLLLSSVQRDPTNQEQWQKAGLPDSFVSWLSLSRAKQEGSMQRKSTGLRSCVLIRIFFSFKLSSYVYKNKPIKGQWLSIWHWEKQSVYRSSVFVLPSSWANHTTGFARSVRDGKCLCPGRRLRFAKKYFLAVLHMWLRLTVRKTCCTGEKRAFCAPHWETVTLSSFGRKSPTWKVFHFGNCTGSSWLCNAGFADFCTRK